MPTFKVSVTVTLHPEPCTLDPEPWTLNPEPSSTTFQGRHAGDQYVTAFKVSVSDDGHTWHFLRCASETVTLNPEP